MLDTKEILTGSFRDPAGFLFHSQGELFRQINPPYLPIYKHLMTCGLYEKLQKNNMLIPHQEMHTGLGFDKDALVIKPEKVHFISYPYEWCFSQLKDAALLTLNIQKMALEHGMILKDASNYNIQFHHGQAIFIDTLSFDLYENGSPWLAYRQFCQHFLAPLMLMSYRDIRLNQLLKVYIDGIPLDLASKLLPWSTKYKLSSLIHIHAHAKMQRKYQNSTTIKQKNQKFSLAALKQLIDNLIQTVENLQWAVQKKSEWYDYYVANNNYSTQALNEKETIIEKWTKAILPKSLWDLGANTGRFSIIAAKNCQQVVSFDIDTSCVESFYQHNRKINHSTLPLILDLTNPSPALGWGHHERDSLMQRGPVDAILALGLIHHLTIANNVPLNKVAIFFSKLTQHLLIEFIPKEDSQIQKLLSTRKDIFDNYDLTNFEAVFSQYFDIVETYPLKGSVRTLYLLKNKETLSNTISHFS